MKVRESGFKINEFKLFSNAEEKEFNNSNVSSFKSHFGDITKINNKNILKDLVNDINLHGDMVCKRCNIKDLKKYKKLISEFLQEAINQTYELEKQGNLDMLGKYKTYSKVKKINKKLEILTGEFVKEQSNSLEILKKVEEIKGLILDMLL